MHKIQILFILLLIFGICFAVGGFIVIFDDKSENAASIPLFIFSFFIMIYSLVFLIDWLFTPYEAIKVDTLDNMLIIGKTSIPFETITNTIYRRFFL